MEKRIPVLDLIFVIDVTASMDCMVEYFNKHLARCVSGMDSGANMFSTNAKVRAKFVLFRDVDSPEGFLEVSPLFDASDYKGIDAYAKTIRAFGGGDLLEDGLTALFEALKIDDPYDHELYTYHRRRILLFTDNDSKLPSLPSYPSTVEEFAAILNDEHNEHGIDTRWLKMAFFVPKDTRYTKLAALTGERIWLKTTGDIGDGKIGLLWNDPWYIMSLLR